MELVDLAPSKPKTRIELRRWWNQICINALSTGKYTYCIDVNEIYCGYVHNYIANIANDQIPCSRCKHNTDMFLKPERAFIGFKS